MQDYLDSLKASPKSFDIQENTDSLHYQDRLSALAKTIDMGSETYKSFAKVEQYLRPLLDDISSAVFDNLTKFSNIRRMFGLSDIDQSSEKLERMASQFSGFISILLGNAKVEVQLSRFLVILKKHRAYDIPFLTMMASVNLLDTIFTEALGALKLPHNEEKEVFEAFQKVSWLFLNCVAIAYGDEEIVGNAPVQAGFKTFKL